MIHSRLSLGCQSSLDSFNQESYGLKNWTEDMKPCYLLEDDMDSLGNGVLRQTAKVKATKVKKKKKK